MTKNSHSQKLIQTRKTKGIRTVRQGYRTAIYEVFMNIRDKITKTDNLKQIYTSASDV